MNPIRGLWLRWKALRLPWRRRFLAGTDLQGNTFWEFRDSLSSTRLRRIVKHARPISHTHYADVTLSPQWHQWLRHTRPEAPSLLEQRAEVARLHNIKQLALLADERWASKPSFLDRPREDGRTAVPSPQHVDGPTMSIEEQHETELGRGDVKASSRSSPVATAPRAVETEKEKERRKNPWEQDRAGPGEKWQPQPWNPSAAPPRR